MTGYRCGNSKADSGRQRRFTVPIRRGYLAGDSAPVSKPNAGYSRYIIRCQTVPKMDFEHVDAICEAAMREFGVPDRIRTDNGNPLRRWVFWD